MRMNAVTKKLTDVLRHPSARLTQHLRIWIGTLDLGLDVLEFEVRAGFCKDYRVDITVTSARLDIDGKLCVGRRAGLQIDERAAVPSVNYVDPVDHKAATFNGVITRWKRIRTSRDEAAYRLRIEPRFAALLKRVHGSRTFKDMTLQEIISALMVDRKNFDAFNVEFNLEGTQERFEQVVMYEESVWNFIACHCRRKGIFWFYRQGRGKHGQRDTIVFADNPRAYGRSIDVPLMPDFSLTGNWHEAALSVNEERTLVPATAELWERNYRIPVPAAVAQLKAALQRVTDLAAATTQAKADPADRATQAALLDGLNQLRDAGLLASAPGGMAFVTPKSAQHSAGENVIVTAGQHMDVSVVMRLRIVAGELISLCAHKLGINLTAANGKITAAALTDGMDLFAQKQLRIASESADVQVAAKSKITINSGGASLVIENGNMMFHGPGAFTIKAASFTFQGPDNIATPLLSLSKSSLKISNQCSSSH
jgi:uncharacterized protein (DUF2345 family)